MKSHLKLLIVLLITSNSLYGQWQTSFKDSLNYFGCNVFFINNDTGFVSMGSYTSAQNGIVFRTLDGGFSWDTVQASNIIYSLDFINDSVGYAAGQDAIVYKTNNMGLNWNYLSGGGPGNDDIFCIHFLDKDSGFYASSSIQKTIDGGNSWQFITSVLGTADYPGRSRIQFIDSLTGFVAQSTITKTVDGGNNWFNLNIPSNFEAISGYFSDLLHGTIVGDNGKVSITSDGGITWSIPDSLGPYPLYDVKFVSDSIGYIIGGRDRRHYPFNSNGVIFKTINRGNSWQMMDSSYYDALLKFHFPSDSIGYAVGFNGLIIKIGNANSLFTSVSNLALPVESITIKPNPATSRVTITVNHPSPVIILNSYGSVILKGFVEIGSTEFDLTPFPSGLYLITTGKITQKFVKQ